MVENYSVHIQAAVAETKPEHKAEHKPSQMVHSTLCLDLLQQWFSSPSYFIFKVPSKFITAGLQGFQNLVC